MSRLAWVTGDRQIAVANADGSNSNLLTAAYALGGSGWSGLARPQLTWSWPTWSPSGEWVAAFAVEASDERSGPVRVVASSVDGVHQEQWLEVPGVAPIYLRWQPQGEALAVLLQRGGQLVLDAVHHDALGRARPVGAGVPLFFSWTPIGQRILVHSAEGLGSAGQLALRDPFGPAEDCLFEREAGNFCAPVFAGEEVAWAAASEGGSRIFASRADGTGARELLQRKGLLALVAAPGGSPRLAVSHAPRGEGTPYAGIELVDLRSGEVRPLTKKNVLAFFWSPTGDWLLVAEVVAKENCLRWWKVAVNGDEPVDLGTFWPTRDVVFYLHFFDQYTGSHPLVSADGRYIAFAGYPAGNGVADLSKPARVYLKDVTRAGEAPEVVDEGSFAVFSG